jgi:hypothetical protein
MKTWLLNWDYKKIMAICAFVMSITSIPILIEAGHPAEAWTACLAALSSLGLNRTIPK